MALLPAPKGLGDLLVAFLRRDPAAFEQFPRAVKPTMLRLARYHGRFLPEDIQEEVPDEAFLILARRGPESFDPTRGSLDAYLRLLVRDAVKHVSASYTPPGRKSRREPAEAENPSPPPVVPLAELPEHREPAHPTAHLVIEQRCEAAIILRRAPARVSRCLIRLYGGGLTLQAVATGEKVSRRTLMREIERYAQPYRVA